MSIDEEPTIKKSQKSPSPEIAEQIEEMTGRVHDELKKIGDFNVLGQEKEINEEISNVILALSKLENGLSRFTEEEIKTMEEEVAKIDSELWIKAMEGIQSVKPKIETIIQNFQNQGEYVSNASPFGHNLRANLVDAFKIEIRDLNEYTSEIEELLKESKYWESIDTANNLEEGMGNFKLEKNFLRENMEAIKKALEEGNKEKLRYLIVKRAVLSILLMHDGVGGSFGGLLSFYSAKYDLLGKTEAERIIQTIKTFEVTLYAYKKLLEAEKLLNLGSSSS